MYQGKYFVFVCCGAGKLTSFMAAEGLKKGLKAIGVDLKKVKIMHGMMHDIGRHEKNIDILVSSTNYKGSHAFPVHNGISFVTGDEKGQQELIASVAGQLREKMEKGE